jgi:predicted  nucleic acid-binding Zn-ribbon protein
LAEKLRVIQDNEQRNTALESEIVDLRNEIDKERNKSLADEATIRKLENILKEKTRQYEDERSRLR